eukprot:TRINITY_DN2005_c0_g1_i1.p1 TRINITY_DN2005_c0_g1~~TRINITY_DN2005_c0_g1_i1.p1  ORF type:complete len:506 (+),score=45.55 TRINITY_DN2005_c0_g1_i1:1351-2868(+)
MVVTLAMKVLLVMSCLFSAVAAYYRGVCLHGGWQGIDGGSPSVFAPGWHLDYFKGKGLTTFRVGFAWQQLQPSLNSAFDANYLSLMDAFVAECKQRSLYVNFVPIPNNWKGTPLGSGSVTIQALTDMWTRLASHYKNESSVWAYDLWNEPDHPLWNTQYGPTLLDGIRAVDPAKPILFATNTGGWGQYYTYHLDGLPLDSKYTNIVYHAHFYFDTPADGTYDHGYDAYSTTIGVDRAQGFVNWCVVNKVKCYAGEYGIPGGWQAGNANCTWGPNTNDPRWNTALDLFLSNLDYYDISGTYWDGGPYSDITDIGPTCDGKDRPQMAVLTQHLGTQKSPVDWQSAPVPPVRYPTEPLIIYNGTIQHGYTEYGWGARDLQNTQHVYPGCTYSIKVTLDNWSAVRFGSPPAFSTLLYESISFYVYPSSVSQQIRMQVTQTNTKQQDVTVGNPVDIPIINAGSWSQVVVPFEKFGLPEGTLLDGFWVQENNSTSQGDIWYDLFVINQRKV